MKMKYKALIDGVIFVHCDCQEQAEAVVSWSLANGFDVDVWTEDVENE